MKTVIAAVCAALVTAGGAGAYVASVTPHQFAQLQHQVTALQHEVTTLKNQETPIASQVACLRTDWNHTGFDAYLQESWSGFDTKSGNATLFSAPSAEDGLIGTGYLLTSDTRLPAC